jgi:hypothetical protein
MLVMCYYINMKSNFPFHFLSRGNKVVSSRSKKNSVALVHERTIPSDRCLLGKLVSTFADTFIKYFVTHETSHGQ